MPRKAPMKVLVRSVMLWSGLVGSSRLGTAGRKSISESGDVVVWWCGDVVMWCGLILITVITV